MLPELEEYIFEAIEASFANHILNITLNRPEKRNAINTVMANEFLYLCKIATSLPDIRVVVLRGNGQTFCAGGDLAAMRGTGGTTKSTVPHQGELHDISIALRNINKPVIVSAHGNVLAGGLMFVCNATHVLTTSDVEFSAPEIKRGLWPHMVMAGLLRVMPRRQAMDFIMRGYSISAERAVELGLATNCVQADSLETATNDLATELASFSPATMRLGLEALNHQEKLDFEEAIPYLMEMLGKTIATADAQEGIMAFLQKRKPEWTGK